MGYVPTIPPIESPPNQRPSPLTTSHRRVDWNMRKLIASFGYAFSGLWYLLHTQRNAQIHCAAGASAVALGLWFGLERWEWLILILTIALVLATEGINTAIETAVDVATTNYHPLARIAKDVAAGVVLLCAIAAILIGCIIFVPHIWPYVVQLIQF